MPKIDTDDPFANLSLVDPSPFPTRAIIDVEGWRSFVGRNPLEAPALPSESEFVALAPPERKALATARKRYHAAFGPIETPYLTRVHGETLRLAALNFTAPAGARPGVVINGLGTVGKSTIAVELGRKYERSLRKKLGHALTEDQDKRYIPVIYITLLGSTNISSLNYQLLRFLGVPVGSSWKPERLTLRLVEVAGACGVSLVIVDDIHFLKLRTNDSMALNDHLKFLASSISATFVYAGIDVDHTKLLTEGTGVDAAHRSQTSHRFKKYDIRPFRKGAEALHSLINSFEKHLLLIRQKPGQLVCLADYIHDRTNGFIGSISALLREGANLAIQLEIEEINYEILEKIRLDKSSEDHRAIVLPKKPKSVGAA